MKFPNLLGVINEVKLPTYTALTIIKKGNFFSDFNKIFNLNASKIQFKNWKIKTRIKNGISFLEKLDDNISRLFWLLSRVVII